jgi:small subunit ribosomal protein S17
MTQNAQPANAGHKPSASPSEEPVGHEQHGFRRKMIGRVVTAKMKKTVVVEVVTRRRDPLYGKYVRSRARYKSHDEKNEYKAGDQVEIQEHRPISRDKRWIVTRLVKKYVEE